NPDLHSFPTRRSSDLLSCGSNDTCLGAGPVDAWAMQMGMNGEWQRLTGLASVTTPTSAGDAFIVPQTLAYDQFLPASGAVRIQRSEEHTSELQSLAYL